MPGEVTFDEVMRTALSQRGAKDLSRPDPGRQKDYHYLKHQYVKGRHRKGLLRGAAVPKKDKKRRENVEIRITADQMVYQSEKIIREMGDARWSADKDDCNSKLEALREAPTR